MRSTPDAAVGSAETGAFADLESRFRLARERLAGSRRLRLALGGGTAAIEVAGDRLFDRITPALQHLAIEVDGRAFGAGQLLVFRPGGSVFFTAVTPAVVMLLGGEPVGERFIEWNFVSSSKERIEQAKADWRAKRMKLPDLDSGEFIRLPE